MKLFSRLPALAVLAAALAVSLMPVSASARSHRHVVRVQAAQQNACGWFCPTQQAPSSRQEVRAQRIEAQRVAREQQAQQRAQVLAQRQQQIEARRAARHQGEAVASSAAPTYGTAPVRVARSGYDRGEVIGGRPSGCPATRFCACALAVKIFGHQVPGLNLAYEWVRRFPHVAPAPDMVAARGGHAFQLLSHVEGLVWKVYDANSGGHLTRIHDRSIAGYTIVNPMGARYASN